MTPPAEAPTLARVLLRRFVPTDWTGRSIVADLDEEFLTRARQNLLRARMWYWRAALQISFAYMMEAGVRIARDGWPPGRQVPQDLRIATRSLRRTPGLTIIVIVTLALGIGMTTAIFTVVDAVLLRALPYPESNRLVRIVEHDQDPEDPAGPMSREAFADLERVESAFESVAAFTTGVRVLTADGSAEEVTIAAVTTGFFRTLGVSATIGREITELDVLGADQVVVLSDGFWRNRFGADPNLVGQTITLDGTPHTVLGVLPPSLDYPSPTTRVFLPISLLGCDDIPCGRNSRFLRTVGRLASGTSVETAEAITRSLYEDLAQTHPESNTGWTASVVPLRETLVGDVRPRLLVLLGGVGFLLLITCANVANLMLMRGARRKREFAIRTALGAGRARVVRQILSESFVLAMLGGGVGLVFAFSGVDLLVALGGGSIPRAHTIGVDLRVAVFTLTTSAAAGLVFGTLPSLIASRTNLHTDLRASGQQAARERPQVASRGLLIGVEGALAVILVTGAILLTRSFWNMTRVDTGFTAENVLSVKVRTDGDVMSGTERNAYRRELVGRLEALPGVTAVGGAKDLPLHGITESYQFTTPDAPDRPVQPQTLIVTGRYFDALGVPILSGRAFTPEDETDRAQVVIVDRALAERHWPSGDAVGRTVNVLGRVPVVIVGIVGDVRYSGVTQEPTPTMYVLPHFGSRSAQTLFVRTASDPRALIDAVRQAVWDVNASQPAVITTMRQVRSATVAEPRFVAVLLGSFAGLALTLALLGVYGVTAYEAGQRKYEIGIRMALGARSRDVVKLMVVQGMVPMALGLAVGLVGALLLSRTLAGLLYGVLPTDLVTFVMVPLMLSTLALVAVYLPARRATRVDPRTAIRAE